MIVDISQKDGVTVIVPEGRIDTTTAKSFLEELEKAKSGDTTHTVMSFEKVNYISSAGLRNIIIFAKYVKSVNGKFALYGLNSSIEDVFKVSGFDKIISITSTFQEAVDLVK